MLISKHSNAGRARLPAHVLGALAALAFLSACADRGSIVVPTLQAATVSHSDAQAGLAGDPDPKARIRFSDFSVLPPQGEHWVETTPLSSSGKWQTQMMFWKIIPQAHSESGLHTVFAMVRSMEVPAALRQQLKTPDDQREFMRLAMNATVENDKAATAGRHRLVLQKADLDRALGYDCFRYDVIDEDRGVPGFEDRAFTMGVHAYTCLDPALRLVVQTMYSQRIPPGETPIDLGQEGEDFLKSLLFTSQLGV